MSFSNFYIYPMIQYRESQNLQKSIYKKNITPSNFASPFPLKFRNNNLHQYLQQNYDYHLLLNSKQ